MVSQHLIIDWPHVDFLQEGLSVQVNEKNLVSGIPPRNSTKPTRIVGKFIRGTEISAGSLRDRSATDNERRNHHLQHPEHHGLRTTTSAYLRSIHSAPGTGAPRCMPAGGVLIRQLSLNTVPLWVPLAL